jgi:nucleotide-binding universal stress UspA family protein
VWRAGFVGMLVGRVALEVVRGAAAPVFVVRRRASASPTDTLRNRRIVAGFDFTSASRAAVDAAVALAKQVRGEVRIVHVIPTAHSVDAEEMARLRSRLEELAAEAATNGVTATSSLTFGDPATALIAETEQEPGSVIAVGARPRSRVARLLLGDVTESLLKTTDATVMVAHAGPVAMPLVALPLLGSPPSRPH